MGPAAAGSARFKHGRCSPMLVSSGPICSAADALVQHTRWEDGRDGPSVAAVAVQQPRIFAQSWPLHGMRERQCPKSDVQRAMSFVCSRVRRTRQARYVCQLPRQNSARYTGSQTLNEIMISLTGRRDGTSITLATLLPNTEPLAGGGSGPRHPAHAPRCARACSAAGRRGGRSVSSRTEPLEERSPSPAWGASAAAAPSACAPSLAIHSASSPSDHASCTGIQDQGQGPEFMCLPASSLS